MRPVLLTTAITLLLVLKVAPASAQTTVPPPAAAGVRHQADNEPSLFGDVAMQRQDRARASQIVGKALESFPEKLLVAHIVGQKPRILENNPNQVKAEWTILVGFDCAEYYQNVVPRLNQALESVAKRKVPTPLVSNAAPKKAAPGQSSPDPNPMFEILTGTRQAPSPLLLALNQASDGSFAKQGEFVVALNTATSSSGDTLHWWLFVLDEALYPVFSEYSNTNPKIRIRFLDKAGKEVKHEDLPVRNAYRGGAWWSAPWLVLAQWPASADGAWYLLSTTQENKARRFVSIMPFIRTQGGAYADRYRMKYSGTFTDSELQRIAAVECRIVRDTNPSVPTRRFEMKLFPQ